MIMIRKRNLYLLTAFLFMGCELKESTTSQRTSKDTAVVILDDSTSIDRNTEFIDVRNLSGMTDTDIKNGVVNCIKKKRYILYSGGYADNLLVSGKDVKFLKELIDLKIVTVKSVGCVGGIQEAMKHNERMSDFLKTQYRERP